MPSICAGICLRSHDLSTALRAIPLVQSLDHASEAINTLLSCAWPIAFPAADGHERPSQSLLRVSEHNIFIGNASLLAALEHLFYFVFVIFLRYLILFIFHAATAFRNLFSSILNDQKATKFLHLPSCVLLSLHDSLSSTLLVISDESS